MEQRTILLTAINAKYIHSNLAVYSLKANAGIYADRVELVEYTINHRPEEVLQGIYKRCPAAVGFSCYIWNIGFVLEVAENLKKVLPETVIFLGGPEVSYDAAERLAKHPFLDFIMIGEGEAAFCEVAELICEGKKPGREWEDVRGLCIQPGVYTRSREPMDMNELVFPYQDMKELENRILYYETMRGCPFSCSYCLSSVEKHVRMKRLDMVYEELAFFLRHRVKQVKFVDRTFNCNHEHAYNIWKYIYEHDNGITNFHFEIGGDLFREEDFELFRKFRPGLVQFEIGVQSTNPKTLEAIRRTVDLGVLASNISAIRAMGNIHQHLDLIAGLPYEDESSFQQSFCDVYAMRPDQLQLGFLKILTGSYMGQAADEYGIQYTSRPPYEVLSTRWLPYEAVIRLKRIEEMVEVYYNSFQFMATVRLLETMFQGPFHIYEELGEYYERNGYFAMKHSRISRYEILWEYVMETFPQQSEKFRQTLTYDLYLRDFVKNPPGFVRERDRAYQMRVRQFLDSEAQNSHVLEGYGGLAARQLFHMVYVDDFTLDFQKLLESGQVDVKGAKTLLFDYRNRNPLHHGANVIAVELIC